MDEPSERSIVKVSLLLAGVACAAAMGGSANAAITVYASSSSFAAAVRPASLGVDTFDDLANRGALTSPLPRAAGDHSYTAAASAGSPDLYGAGDASDGWLSTFDATSTITFSGFDGISAIGGTFFDTSGAGDFAQGAIKLTVTDSLGATSMLTISDATLSIFRGFTTNGYITSLTVSAVQPESGSLWPTVNDLTLGVAVPEPATWAMMILGFGLAGTALRRRTSASALT